MFKQPSLQVKHKHAQSDVATTVESYVSLTNLCSSGCVAHDLIHLLPAVA